MSEEAKPKEETKAKPANVGESFVFGVFLGALGAAVLAAVVALFTFSGWSEGKTSGWSDGFDAGCWVRRNAPGASRRGPKWSAFTQKDGKVFVHLHDEDRLFIFPSGDWFELWKKKHAPGESIAAPSQRGHEHERRR